MIKNVKYAKLDINIATLYLTTENLIQYKYLCCNKSYQQVNRANF